jgi:hypothetical protein
VSKVNHRHAAEEPDELDVRTSELFLAVCTTLDSATFALYASFAKVFPGPYFGQLGAGAAAGFLAKLATIACIVSESVFSAAVASEG